jgi:hypothetical protein
MEPGEEEPSIATQISSCLFRLDTPVRLSLQSPILSTGGKMKYHKQPT